MTRLPLIVGFGGVGPAGRSSFHHAYRRTVIDSLDERSRNRTLLSLAVMMQLVRYCDGQYLDRRNRRVDPEAFEGALSETILAQTLIRRIEPQLFDPDCVAGNSIISLPAGLEQEASVLVETKTLPEHLPPGCLVEATEGEHTRIRLAANTEIKLQTFRSLAVQAAGQLPSGFEPEKLYNSRFHPRGLQLSIIAASDAIRSLGLGWDEILERVRPDEICVYAASAMGQLDRTGTGGMTQARLRGGRPSAKQLPLGLNQMPADFVNAYVLGNIGATGAAVGACATFLYNLRAGVEDIQSGRRRVAVVGNAEAPLLPEIIEGYAAMSALATDDALKKIDATEVPDYRRASRPFGENCGFVLGESGQYIVLFDDALAVEMGAQIHGAVTDVFVNADGFKKSISAPGPGNYVTLAKAVASARAMFGDAAVRERSFVQAHGSSTAQNRVTESRILDAVAAAFGISDWPVTAVKAFVGHSLAPASADQMVSSLGVFRDEILPGIKTLRAIADDVYDARLNIAIEDLELTGRCDISFLNAKGFGGNNATGVVISPTLAEQMLTNRYSAAALSGMKDRRLAVLEAAQDYDEACMRGPMQPIYRFGEALIDEEAIELNMTELRLPGFPRPIELSPDDRYDDMLA
jgi:acetoacetyl-[acyl-carrier protein] synthase